jgi:hypothetical protein
MTWEAWFGLAAAVIAALALWLTIWWRRKDRVKTEASEKQKAAEAEAALKRKAAEREAAIKRKNDAAAERLADEVIVLIDRGESLEDGQPSWNVRVDNKSPQPIHDVRVTYSIQAWQVQPKEEGQVGQKIKTGSWEGPYRPMFPLIKAGETVRQPVDWGVQQVDVQGPTLLGAKFLDYRGQFWVRGQRGPWRSVEADEFNAFWPDVPDT